MYLLCLPVFSQNRDNLAELWPEVLMICLVPRPALAPSLTVNHSIVPGCVTRNEAS